MARLSVGRAVGLTFTQGRDDGQRQLVDVHSWAGHLLPAGSVFEFCPADITREVTASGMVVFGAACSSCPLRTPCTTAAGGRKMTLTPHDRIKREHRTRAKGPDFQVVYRQNRPMIERSIAWMTRGARRVPCCGVAKNHAWWATRAAAINLRRLLNLGLSRQDGVWALG